MEEKRSIRLSASLFYGFPDHAHPSRKVGWGKLEDIKHDGLQITSIYIEVKFGKVHQSVGSQGSAGLVDKTGVVPYLHFNENACRQDKSNSRAYSGTDQAGVNHIELFVVMLKTKIYIIDFTPVQCG